MQFHAVIILFIYFIYAGINKINEKMRVWIWIDDWDSHISLNHCMKIAALIQEWL